MYVAYIGEKGDVAIMKKTPIIVCSNINQTLVTNCETPFNQDRRYFQEISIMIQMGLFDFFAVSAD